MGGVDLIVAHPGTEGLVNCRNIALSNNVGDVKHYACTRLRALVEERHFALVGGLRFPTWVRF